MSPGLLHPEKFAAIGMLGTSLRESAFLESYTEKTSDKFRVDALKNSCAFPMEYGLKEMGIKPSLFISTHRYNLFGTQGIARGFRPTTKIEHSGPKFDCSTVFYN